MTAGTPGEEGSWLQEKVLLEQKEEEEEEATEGAQTNGATEEQVTEKPAPPSQEAPKPTPPAETAATSSKPAAQAHTLAIEDGLDGARGAGHDARANHDSSGNAVEGEGRKQLQKASSPAHSTTPPPPPPPPIATAPTPVAAVSSWACDGE